MQHEEFGSELDACIRWFYRYAKARDIANPAQRIAYLIYNHYMNEKYFDDLEILLSEIYIDQRFPEFLRYFVKEGEKRLQRWRDLYSASR